MDMGGYVERIRREGPEAEVLRNFYRHCVAAPVAPDQTLLILDARGFVVHCESESNEMGGNRCDFTLGQSASEIFPELKLDTQDAGLRGRPLADTESGLVWRKSRMVDPGGGSSRVEFLLEVVNVNRRRLFLLRVRHGATAEASGLVPAADEVRLAA